ncbi:MAG: outer membrane protein transport protein [Gemmatimonadota bacterium]|jgi:long-chain fatty acid transport protein
MKNGILRAGAALGLALLVAAPLHAQGAAVYTHSACLSARGQAGVAATCKDGSSIYYNPAAIVTTPGAIGAGVTVIFNGGSYTYDSTGVVVKRDPAAPIVPHAYVTYPLGDRLAVGAGVFAPYGLTVDWPETFEGRFMSWKTVLQGIYIQPTVAYDLLPGVLSVGAGLDVVLGGIEFNQHIDGPIEDNQLALLGVPPGTDIAAARLKGSGTGVAFNVGVLARLGDRLSIGARYMSPAKVSLDGNATFNQIATGRTLAMPKSLLNPSLTGDTIIGLDALVAPEFQTGGALSDQTVSSEITFPPQAVVGVRYEPIDGLQLLGDFQWTGWDTFDQIIADFQYAPQLTMVLDYKNTYTYRLGADYEVTDGFAIRAGWSYNTAATPDRTVTPLLPESMRDIATAGFGYTTGNLTIDVFYNYIRQGDRRGRVRDAWVVPVPISALNIGVYHMYAHLVGVTLGYRIGPAR